MRPVIQDGRVYKKGYIAPYMRVMHDLNPPGFQFEEGGYSYDFMPDEHPTAEQVIEALDRTLWSRDGGTVDLEPYGAYCRERFLRFAKAWKVEHCLRIVDWMYESMGAERGVWFVHGDLTLENCFLYEGRVVLIDPAHPHGATTKQMELGKLAQSTVTDWPRCEEFEGLITPHLVAHWCRLMPYWEPKPLPWEWMNDCL